MISDAMLRRHKTYMALHPHGPAGEAGLRAYRRFITSGSTKSPGAYDSRTGVRPRLQMRPVRSWDASVDFTMAVDSAGDADVADRDAWNSEPHRAPPFGPADMPAEKRGDQWVGTNERPEPRRAPPVPDPMPLDDAQTKQLKAILSKYSSIGVDDVFTIIDLLREARSKQPRESVGAMDVRRRASNTESFLARFPEARHIGFA
jgi:hypothetical protein